jgi:metal-responsive CopG/Arc/MetJ family transcriptional regulator
MSTTIATSLPPEDLAALDRLCRDQRMSRDEAVETALRWYIEREGDLPAVDDLDETERR